MSRSKEYCILCGVRLQIISINTVDTIHELQALDLNTMTAVGKREPIAIKTEKMSYSVRCPKCGNSQPVEVILTDD